MKAVARDHLPQEEWEVAQAAALRKRILVVNVIVYKDRNITVAIFFSNSMAFLAVAVAGAPLLEACRGRVRRGVRSKTHAAHLCRSHAPGGAGRSFLLRKRGARLSFLAPFQNQGPPFGAMMLTYLGVAACCWTAVVGHGHQFDGKRVGVTAGPALTGGWVRLHVWMGLRQHARPGLRLGPGRPADPCPGVRACPPPTPHTPSHAPAERRGAKQDGSADAALVASFHRAHPIRKRSPR